MSITIRKTAVQTGAGASDVPQNRVLRADVRGRRADSDGRRLLDMSGVNIFSVAGRSSLSALQFADRDGWRWQLMIGLGRTLLFVATFWALAMFVDAFG